VPVRRPRGSPGADSAAGRGPGPGWPHGAPGTESVPAGRPTRWSGRRVHRLPGPTSRV